MTKSQEGAVVAKLVLKTLSDEATKDVVCCWSAEERVVTWNQKEKGV